MLFSADNMFRSTLSNPELQIEERRWNKIARMRRRVIFESSPRAGGGGGSGSGAAQGFFAYTPVCLVLGRHLSLMAAGHLGLNYE